MCHLEALPRARPRPHSKEHKEKTTGILHVGDCDYLMASTLQPKNTEVRCLIGDAPPCFLVICKQDDRLFAHGCDSLN